MTDTNAEQLSYLAIEAPAEERAAFIRRTYQHLGVAILAFIALEVFFFKTGLADSMARTMLGGRLTWLLVLGGFMLVSWIAEKWAESDTSQQMQYLGLGLYVLAESILFVPLLWIAARFASPDVIPMAGLITTLLFVGLTVTAFTTRADFSWMGSILKIGGCVALGVIVCSLTFGFNLGLIFSGVMVVFAGGAILYTTHNIMEHYNTNQHVAASLALFASVALLFWYVLRILIALSSNRD